VILAAISPSDVADSVKESFFMFWHTLWPLVLGFGLSGAVQAFVSREQLQRTLGDHRPPAVARATGFGMVSSSCSYAASAMAKSLFQKGADFTSAMVFMFASTNLVLELGIVLVILMGWQFAAAEFVGGPVMIVLLVIVGAVAFRTPLVEQARRRLAGGGEAGAEHEGHDGHAGHEAHAAHQAHAGHEHQGHAAHGPGSPASIRTKAGWADAASYTMADLTMLRRELVIGYLVAGFLAVLVPVSWWNALFIHGHGVWTTLENAAIGPVIAFISFVCSVGNVPMAAALWHGGIGFGGVVSFVFADLVALPLVLIYRKFYGTRLTLRLVGVFWLVMAAAGLIVEGLFSALGWVPQTRPAQPVTSMRFEWNYTTFLNIAFLVVFAGLVWLARNRQRWGGGRGYAIDPVCGMQVQTANAPARTTFNNTHYWFCADRCRERFEADPARFTKQSAPAQSVPVVLGRGPAPPESRSGQDE
jgi:uncharacterized membrane protein YraQ (UPF0718 family)/YHS domain-containing protein